MTAAAYGLGYGAYRSPAAMKKAVERIQQVRGLSEGVRNSAAYQALKRNKVATRLGGMAGMVAGDRQGN